MLWGILTRVIVLYSDDGGGVGNYYKYRTHTGVSLVSYRFWGLVTPKSFSVCSVHGGSPIENRGNEVLDILFG